MREPFRGNNALHADIVAKDRIIRRADFHHASALDFTNDATGDVTGLTDRAFGDRIGFLLSRLRFGVGDFFRVKRHRGWHRGPPSIQTG